MNTSSPTDQSKKTIVVKVMKKSKELLTYNKRGGGSMQYFNIVAANGTTLYNVKVYQIHKFQMIRVGVSYRFANCIEKPGDSLWVVSSSSIGYVKSVEVDSGIAVDELPEDQPATGAKRSLEQALGTTARSTVQAKIVKVSPVKFTRQNTLAVRCLGLKDESGYAKVALFESLAERSYEPNTTVELTGVYQKTHNKMPTQLAVTRETTCEFLTDNNNVSIEEIDVEHFLKDPDFQIRDGDSNVRYEVEAINDVMVYDGCTTLGCRLKKLKDGSCPTCEGSTSKTTFMSRLTIKGPNNFEKELPLFQQNLERLFGMFPTEVREDTAIELMINQLPVTFTAKFTGSNLYDITKSN